jgi:hypothetical protein
MLSKSPLQWNKLGTYRCSFYVPAPQDMHIEITVVFVTKEEQRATE